MFNVENPIEIKLSTTKKSEKKFQRLKNKIEKQIREHQKEFSEYKIVIKIKKKTWIRKIKIFMIALLFSYRLRKIHQRIQYLGVSNILINPNFRELEYIIKQISTQQLCQNKTYKITAKKSLFYFDTIQMVVWKFIVFVSISMYLIIFPLFINFTIQSFFVVLILFFIDIVYILDFLIGFNIAYKQDKIQYEQSRKKIILRYLKNEFIINLLTSIPFFSIFHSNQIFHDLNSDLKLTNIALIIQFLKILKVFQLKKLTRQNLLPYNLKFILRINGYKINSFRIFYITFMIVHVVACLFIKISLIQSLEPNTWLFAQKLIFESQVQIYISSLYYCFVVLTTVGFGDIVSQNNLERTFTLFWMLFGIAFYSFTIGYITNFFTLKENKKTLLATKIKKFDKFASVKKIDQDLQDKVRQGLQHSAREICYRWINDDINFIKNIPKYQKYLFLRSVHSELFKCKLFFTNNFHFTIRVIELLKPLKIKKGEFLWMKDDYAKFICFLTRGKLFLMTNNPFIEIKKIKRSRKSQIIKKSLKKLRSLFMFWRQSSKVENKVNLKSLKNNIKRSILKNEFIGQQAKNFQELQQGSLLALKLYSEGSYIGEEEIIQNCKRQYWVKAATDVELMILSRDDFENVFKKEFPHDYNMLVEDAVKKIKNQKLCQTQLLKKMRQIIQTQKNQFSNNLNTQQQTNFQVNIKSYKNKKIYKNIKQFFENEQIKPKFQETFFNINIQEYQKDINNEEEEENFQNVNTPGFNKIFKEWQSLCIKLNDEQDFISNTKSLEKIKKKVKIDFCDKNRGDTLNRQQLEEHTEIIKQVKYI